MGNDDGSMQIDLDSDRTVLDQLRSEIRRIVKHDGDAPGTRLPTVREIALDLGVNANVVRRICRELAGEGYLMPKDGQGTFGIGLGGDANARKKKVFDV